MYSHNDIAEEAVCALQNGDEADYRLWVGELQLRGLCDRRITQLLERAGMPNSRGLTAQA